MRRLFLPLALALIVHHSAAAAADESVRTEARERFDRGLKLFNQGDNGGALAEFRRAYELVAHPLVLFNMGLVHAASRQPVEAVDVFERLLKNPGSLDAERLAAARQARDEQFALVGRISVAANVDGAVVEVDNVEVGKTPLREPIRVSSGEHIIGVIAARHVPERRKIGVAGKSTIDVKFQLQPLEGRLAQLAVKTNVPDADVLVDGVSVGKTPLAASLAIPPGAHSLELRRAGYATARKSLNLGEGTSGEVELRLEPDASSLARSGGSLRLAISEEDAVVFVDGEPVGAYAGALRLPEGRHRIRVERAEFFPFERDVAVPNGGSTEVGVELEPTPDKRAAYRSSAVGRQTIGWITTIGGGVVVLGSAGFLIWNQGQKQDAEDEFDRVAARNEPGSGTECDPQSGSRGEACDVELDVAVDELDSARGRDIFGFIGLGVGAAATAVGLTLLLTNDDPDRYEPKPESDVFARARISPGGVSIEGRF